MTKAEKRKPTLAPEQILNPRYAGATPEMVGLALLKHRPKDEDAKAKPSRVTAKRPVRPSI